jgi:hypothetical protein
MGHHEFKKHEQWFDENVQNLYVEGSTLNSNGHKIQAKLMQITGTR